MMSIIGYLIVFAAAFDMFLYNKKLDKIENKDKSLKQIQEK